MRPPLERYLDRARGHLLAAAATNRTTAEESTEAIGLAAQLMADALQGGGKLLLCGNGGSAADCQHMAAELTGQMRKDVRRPGIAAIALTTDTSFLTAYSNDFGYAAVFERQVESLGKPADVLIGISTSGESENVIRAFNAAKRIGIRTIALTGRSGRLATMADVAIRVPSSDTQHIQETHVAVVHVLCDLIESSILERDAGREMAGKQ
jgi:D-sedoheptulose 7-phosphate isomerase